jgi:PAS domain S-box-containing protein
MQKEEILLRQLDREKQARKAAENILEQKSLELYNVNQNLIALTNDLVEKEQKISAILDATADGIIVLNQKNTIEISNQSTCNNFGYSLDEIIGKNIKKLIPTFNQNRDIILSEATGIRKDNSVVPLELAISKINLSENLLTIIVLRDISERKHEEERRAVKHAITKILAESSFLEEVSSKILEIMCKKMRLDVGSLWEINPNDKKLHCLMIWSMENSALKKFSSLSKKTSFAYGMGLPGRVWKSRQACWIEDLDKDKNFPRKICAKNANLTTAFALPIIYGNEVLGVFEFFTKKIYPLDNDLMDLLNTITEQIGIFIERKNVAHNLTIARRIGMAEIATSVLHNIGNVLNSLNISLDSLGKNLNQSALIGLNHLKKLMQNPKEELPIFLAKNPIGLDLVDYLIELSFCWNNEQKRNIEEIEALKKNIQHIKDIVKSQQSLTGSSSHMKELVLIKNCLEDAILLSLTESYASQIKIQRKYAKVKTLWVDKVKLIQILVNLIRNAYESLFLSEVASKTLTITTFVKNKKFYIQISDNGMGIDVENLKKIFAFGFTTKKTGHGFGLHGSFIAAKAMQGQLTATSQGLGKGATFTLELPASIGVVE